MNANDNDLAQLEIELRALQPLRPSAALDDRLAHILDSARSPGVPALPWWQQLGFHRPLAAFTWGLAAPAAAVCAVLLLHFTGPGGGHPAPPPAFASSPDSAPAVAAAVTAPTFDSATASNVVYQTRDEGVVYDAAQQPARQVRYRSQDTLAWRNPRTGAQVEVSYPREEVVLTPIALR